MHVIVLYISDENMIELTFLNNRAPQRVCPFQRLFPLGDSAILPIVSSPLLFEGVLYKSTAEKETELGNKLKLPTDFKILNRYKTVY